MVSNWGLGFVYFLHVRGLDKATPLYSTAKQGLLTKACEQMINVIFRLKLCKEPGMDHYVKRPHYYLGSVYSQLGNVDESLFWLTKAKVKGQCLPFNVVIDYDYKDLKDKDTPLRDIITEPATYSKERLAFLQDRKKYMAKLSGTSIMEMSLTASQLGVHEGQLSNSVLMSNSMIMNAVLTTSTLNFLSDGHFNIAVNWKHFFEPVKPLQNEAETRLKERLKLYGLEARRDIPGDGNCQMYSLSHQLTDTIKHAKFIRRSVVSWLRKNAELQLVFLIPVLYLSVLA